MSEREAREHDGGGGHGEGEVFDPAGASPQEQEASRGSWAWASLCSAGSWSSAFVPRIAHTEAMAGEEAAAAGDVPVVRVATVERSPRGAGLALPGSVQPLQETAIYARANGYVRKLARRHRRAGEEGAGARRARPARHRRGAPAGRGRGSPGATPGSRKRKTPARARQDDQQSLLDSRRRPGVVSQAGGRAVSVLLRRAAGERGRGAKRRTGARGGQRPPARGPEELRYRRPRRSTGW